MRISDWSSDVCSSDLYALYRAAELTLELGAERFAVHDRLTERFTKVTRDTYDPFPYYGYGAYWYRRPYFGHPSPHTYRYKRTTYLAELTVEPFTGIAPGDVGKVYRAREGRPPTGRESGGERGGQY